MAAFARFWLSGLTTDAHVQLTTTESESGPSFYNLTTHLLWHGQLKPSWLSLYFKLLSNTHNNYDHNHLDHHNNHNNYYHDK